MTIATSRTGKVIVAAVIAALSVGCGSEPEVAPQPGPDAGPPVASSTPPPPPPPPPPQVAPCDANTQLALTTMIQGRAAAEAPNAKPEGAPVCFSLPEGQMSASQTMMLEPGHCYTVIGQGAGGLMELDMQLMLDLSGGAQLAPALAAFANQPLAVDMDSGPMSTIGAKQSCYAWPFPIPAMVKIVVKSRTGTGSAAAQLYKKKK